MVRKGRSVSEERELRQMSRPALIDIIYALQQREKALISENMELKRRTMDPMEHMASASALADAALSLNKFFEYTQLELSRHVELAQSIEEQTRQAVAQVRAQTEAILCEVEAKCEQAGQRMDQIAAQYSQITENIFVCKQAFAAEVSGVFEKYPFVEQFLTERSGGAM